jgi:hypothetical protein
MRTPEPVRSSIEVIADLDKGAQEWGSALLVVGFPDMSKVVPNGCPERLQILDEMMREGGIPVGMLSMKVIDDEDHYFYCVFDEYAGTNWALLYMVAFVKEMTQPGIIAVNTGVFMIH